MDVKTQIRGKIMEQDLDAKLIYVELTSLREEMQNLRRMVAEILAERRPAIRTNHPHIVRIEGVRGGEPVIRGTGISVRTIVERTRLGDSPEKIVDDYPILSIAQVYDALSYYYEHPQEIEQYIAENKEALWKKSGSS
jgi:uncharacterized protein (DUF433 family)